MKRILVLHLLLALFTDGLAGKGVRTFNDAYDAYIPYYYQPAGHWDHIRRANFGQAVCPGSLLQRLQGRKQAYVMCPWWYEDLYSGLPAGDVNRIRQIGYAGYVLNPSTGTQMLVNEWNNANGVLDDTAYLHVPFDLVVYCRSGAGFDDFLRNRQAQLNFLHSVFDAADGAVNRKHQGRKPEGIHFYLPEVSFDEKKEFIRFIKSVSMVVDAYEIDGVRPYEGDQCVLTITFSPEAKNEMNFISGLLEFTDAVYFARYDEYGLLNGTSEKVVRFTDPTSLWMRIRNQFYLLHLEKSDRQVLEKGSSDFQELMAADYADFGWLLYFYIDLILVLVLVVMVVLYYVSSRFYMFVESYRDYAAPVLIALVIEILVVLLFVIESFSRYTILINMDDNGRYFLLIVPVAFIFIDILLKKMNRNERIP